MMDSDPSLSFQINFQARKLRGREPYSIFPSHYNGPMRCPLCGIPSTPRPHTAQLTPDRTKWAPMVVVPKNNSLLPCPATTISYTSRRTLYESSVLPSGAGQWLTMSSAKSNVEGVQTACGLACTMTSSPDYLHVIVD